MTVFGCSDRKPPGLGKLYPVKTIVKFSDGTPVNGASVIFHAVKLAGGEKVWSHAATTDTNGTAMIFSDGRYPGVPVGSYSVTVTKIVVDAKLPPSAPTNTEEQRAYDQYMRSGHKSERYSLIADMYALPDETPLAVEVKPRKENTVILDVGPKVRIDKPVRALVSY